MQLQDLRSHFHRTIARRLFLGAAAASAIAGACVAPAWADDAAQQGNQVFMASGCFACHGQMGNGGSGPRFREDSFLGLTDYVVAQILIGRGIMPAFANRLNDDQIAAVASYIRDNWGNNFGDVKPGDVAQVRREIASEQAQTGSSEPHQPPSATQHPATQPPQQENPATKP